MEEKLLAIILKNTYTKVSLYRRLRRVREYYEASFFSQAPAVPTLREFLGEKGESALEIADMTAWGGGFFQSFTRETFYGLLRAWQNRIETIPVFTLYLEFDLSEEEIIRMGAWMRQKVDPTALLILRSDPHLSIGCAFAWKGMFHDYSYRFFLDPHKEEIRQIVEETVAKSTVAKI